MKFIPFMDWQSILYYLLLFVLAMGVVQSVSIGGLFFLKGTGEKRANVFYGLTGSMSDDKMRAIAKEISPKLSALSDDISLNENLFKRVKEIYKKRKRAGDD